MAPSFLRGFRLGTSRRRPSVRGGGRRGPGGGSFVRAFPSCSCLNVSSGSPFSRIPHIPSPNIVQGRGRGCHLTHQFFAMRSLPSGLSTFFRPVWRTGCLADRRFFFCRSLPMMYDLVWSEEIGFGGVSVRVLRECRLCETIFLSGLKGGG